MLTYGFYNSKNGDRRYDAIQMSSIFDGIINDGVYMSIGDHFYVSANGDSMIVNVGTGRAWFNHTWNLNDTLIPITIPQSEVILSRIDAIVLEVNSELSVRANSIKLVKGKASLNNPQKPTLTNTATVHQHPLAYVTVPAGASTIRQANVQNVVGTSVTPYVTGIIKTINIDSMVSQWEDQWDEFYENQTEDITETNAYWKSKWNTFYNQQTKEITDANANWASKWDLYYNNMTRQMNNEHKSYTDTWSSNLSEAMKQLDNDLENWTSKWNTFYNQQTKEITDTNTKWKNQWDAYYSSKVSQMDQNYATWTRDWNSYYSSYTSRMNTTASNWEKLWNDWFYSFVNENTELIADWKDKTRTDFMAWWNGIKDTLDDMPAGDLAAQFEDLKAEMSKWESFKKNVYEDHALYYTIEDTGYRTYTAIQDSGRENIRDSSNDILMSRTISHDPLIDSNGNVIEGRLLFAFK